MKVSQADLQSAVKGERSVMPQELRATRGELRMRQGKAPLIPKIRLNSKMVHFQLLLFSGINSWQRINV